MKPGADAETHIPPHLPIHIQPPPPPPFHDPIFFPSGPLKSVGIKLFVNSYVPRTASFRCSICICASVTCHHFFLSSSLGLKPYFSRNFLHCSSNSVSFPCNISFQSLSFSRRSRSHFCLFLSISLFASIFEISSFTF